LWHRVVLGVVLGGGAGDARQSERTTSTSDDDQSYDSTTKIIIRARTNATREHGDDEGWRWIRSVFFVFTVVVSNGTTTERRRRAIIRRGVVLRRSVRFARRRVERIAERETTGDEREKPVRTDVWGGETGEERDATDEWWWGGDAERRR
jgi:hypothetical protein